MEITHAELLDETGTASGNFESGKSLTIRLHFRMRRDGAEPDRRVLAHEPSQHPRVPQRVRRSSRAASTRQVRRGRFDIKIGLHLRRRDLHHRELDRSGASSRSSPSARPRTAFYVSSVYRRGIANLGAEYSVERGRGRADVPAPTDSPAAASDPRCSLSSVFGSRAEPAGPPASAATSGTHSVEPASLNAFRSLVDDVRRAVVG